MFDMMFLMFKNSKDGAQLKNSLINYETVRQGDIFTELVSDHFKKFANEYREESELATDEILKDAFEKLKELYSYKEPSENDLISLEYSTATKAHDDLVKECLEDFE